MHPYKVNKATPVKFYGCICDGPSRLTYRDGQEVGSPCLIFSLFCISFMYELKMHCNNENILDIKFTVQIYTCRVLIYRFLYFSTGAFLAEA